MIGQKSVVMHYEITSESTSSSPSHSLNKT